MEFVLNIFHHLCLVSLFCILFYQTDGFTLQINVCTDSNLLRNFAMFDINHGHGFINKTILWPCVN